MQLNSSIVVTVLLTDFGEHVFEATLAKTPVLDVEALLVFFKVKVDLGWIKRFVVRNKENEVAVKLTDQISIWNQLVDIVFHVLAHLLSVNVKVL